MVQGCEWVRVVMDRLHCTTARQGQQDHSHEKSFGRGTTAIGRQTTDDGNTASSMGFRGSNMGMSRNRGHEKTGQLATIMRRQPYPREPGRVSQRYRRDESLREQFAATCHPNAGDAVTVAAGRPLSSGRLQARLKQQPSQVWGSATPLFATSFRAANERVRIALDRHGCGKAASLRFQGVPPSVIRIICCTCPGLLGPAFLVLHFSSRTPTFQHDALALLLSTPFGISGDAPNNLHRRCLLEGRWSPVAGRESFLSIPLFLISNLALYATTASQSLVELSPQRLLIPSAHPHPPISNDFFSLSNTPKWARTCPARRSLPTRRSSRCSRPLTATRTSSSPSSGAARSMPSA